MARHHLPGTPETFIRGKQTNETVNRKLAGIVINQLSHPIEWYILFGIGAMVMQALAVTVVWLLYKGIGIWGVNQPSGWGFDIINFVWWIGIGHAGTLISAILLLLRQQWRTSINRFAEAMTIFAVMCAGMYPLLHTGRPWVAYWLMPIGPNVLGMWPQFRSPLVWDVFAVSTYLTVSALFWFTGLIPDLAMLRDRCTNKLAKLAYGLPAMGWRGSAKHWFRYEQAYLILAGLSAPLVLSVHTIVSFDFAVSILPGWHTTIFPPYFVAGAVYAGFAMVLTLALPVRYWYNVKDFITMNHIDWMAKIMLATGLVVFYGYLLEIFFAFYSANQFEIYMMKNRMTGPYWPLYWGLILCNGFVPQLLWSKKVRHNLPVLFMICCVVSIGMWLERFVIIPVSLHRDFLPSSWGMYIPSLGDWTMFAGTIGMFIFMMFLFIRFLPFIPIFEMKDLLHKMNSHHGDGHGDAHGGEDTHGGGSTGRAPIPSPVPAGGE
jgi:molybdopterin-containing oxidoreductase family membrane subunit